MALPPDHGLDAYPSKTLGISGSWNGHTWGIAYQEIRSELETRRGAI